GRCTQAWPPICFPD
nr:Chain A, cyc-MC12 [Helianthus annuus]